MPDLDIRYVADLARIDLTEEEVAQFTDQLGGILQYVDKLGELDLENVEPTSHPAGPVDAVRADEPHDRMLGTEAVLSNAPRKSGDQFSVAKVVE